MLVERDAELAAIRAVLDGVRAGRGRTLVLCGEPGIGKSALLARAREAAAATVLAIRGTEMESELPFAGLRDLLTPVLWSFAELPPPQRRALEGALAIGEADAVQPFAVFAGLLTVLAHVADRRPLLICVDDFHWLDAGSGGAVRFVAARIAMDPIALLVTSREVPTGFEGDSVEIRQVGRLSRRGSHELLTGRAEAGLDDALVDRLHDATGGNPLALVELAGDAAALAAVSRGDLRTVPVGEAIRESFARRLRALADGPRRTLVVAATAQRDDMTLLVEAAARLGATLDDFVAAEAADVIALDAGRLQFRHPLLRSVVQAETAPAEHRRVHTALADAAAALSRADEEAWHRAAAAVVPDEAVAARLDAAAADYERRSGHLGAARALELAAKLTPGAERRAQRLHRAAEAARRAGQPTWAVALLDQATGLAESPELRAQIDFSRNVLAAWSGSTSSAREGYESLAEALRETDPDGAATAYGFAAAQAIVEGRIETARRDAAAARELIAGREPSAYARAVVHHADAIVGALTGDRGAPGQLRSAAQELLDTGQLSGREYVALPLLWLEDYRLALALIESRLSDARRVGDLRALTAALEVDATRRYRIGDWAGAHAAAAESARLSRESRQWVQLAYSLATLSIVMAGQGHAGALPTADEADALAREHGLAEIEQYVAAARGLAELGRERTDAALEHLERAERYAGHAGQREPHVHQWAPDLIEAAVRLKRYDVAEAATLRLSAAAEVTGRVWALAVVARARGMLADGDDYAGHFEAALARHAATMAPFERARLQLSWGSRLRRDRHRVASREHLETALRAFEALGARQWATMAARELRATGATLRRHDPAARDELTPQEHQIAMLVMDGASNKEAAASMFLSTKTVETHLSRIYRKLGVRSRHELIASMMAAPAPPELHPAGASPSLRG